MIGIDRSRIFYTFAVSTVTIFFLDISNLNFVQHITSQTFERYIQVHNFIISGTYLRKHTIEDSHRGLENKYSLQHIERLLTNDSLFHDNEKPTENLAVIHKASPFEHPKLPYPVHFVTYSNNNMKNTRERLVRQAHRSSWFSSVVGYSPNDLPLGFQEEFHSILSLKRGAGYWIWRFPVFELMLDRIALGEYIIFLDAGFTLNRLGKPMLLEWLKELDKSKYDIMGFQIHELEHQYTTNRIFEAFNVDENDFGIRNSGQIQGGVVIIRNGPHIRKNLSRIYQVLEKDPYLITDIYNEEASQLDNDFIDNRHDQSLHSITQKKYGSIVKKWICDDSVPFRNYYLRNMNNDEVAKWEEVDVADESPW